MLCGGVANDLIACVVVNSIAPSAIICFASSKFAASRSRSGARIDEARYSFHARRTTFFAEVH